MPYKEKIQAGDYDQGVEISINKKSEIDTEITFEGGTLWISRDHIEDFKAELKELLEKYMI